MLMVGMSAAPAAARPPADNPQTAEDKTSEDIWLQASSTDDDTATKSWYEESFRAT